MKSTSPVIQLLQIVWDNSCKANSHSWRLLNGAMHNALRLAVIKGFPFELSDFKQIGDRFRPGYWMGDGERIYLDACQGPYEGIGQGVLNESAARSFEAWVGRKPFIWQGKRLAVGSEMWWWEKWPRVPADFDPEKWIDRHYKATRFHVTGIKTDSLRLSWYDNPGYHQQGKPARLLKIGRTDILAANAYLAKARKRWKKQQAEAEMRRSEG